MQKPEPEALHVRLGAVGQKPDTLRWHGMMALWVVLQAG